MQLKDEQVLSKIFCGLEKVCSRPDLLERYEADLGNYYRKIFRSWRDESPGVDPEELFWLEHYARELLFRAGVNYRGQPPQRSVVGLPGLDRGKIDPPPPPYNGVDQSCLFP